MFSVNNISSGYGEVTVLHGLSFEVQHEIYAVLGANGAGKSTLMKTIARLLPLTGGEIHFQGENVTSIEPHILAAKGLALVPQEHHIFPDLTVAENLSVGSLVGKRPKKERLEEIYELFPDVVARLNQKAGTLSGGEAQMVAVSRALMQDPVLLLLDEPTSGLSPLYVDSFFEKIKEIHEKKNVSVMLAEQNAAKALEISDRVMILSLGKVYLIDDVANCSLETMKEGYRI
jgi:branched-chain amino acid transport system ATP-binding protein